MANTTTFELSVANIPAEEKDTIRRALKAALAKELQRDVFRESQLAGHSSVGHSSVTDITAEKPGLRR